MPHVDDPSLISWPITHVILITQKQMASFHIKKFLKSSSVKALIENCDLACKTIKSYQSDSWKDICTSTMKSTPIEMTYQAIHMPSPSVD